MLSTVTDHWRAGCVYFITVLVAVLSRNDPPVLTIDGLSTVSVTEGDEVTKLKTLTCSDREVDAARAYITSLTPSSPCGSCFAVTPCRTNTKTEFCLYFYPSEGDLSYQAAPSYTALVTCTDDVNFVTGVIDIRVIDNQAPTFVNPSLVFEEFIVRATDSRRAGYLIYDVDGEDEDRDAIFYSMTTDPDNDLFEIGYADGKIRAAKDLRLLCEDNVQMAVTLADSDHPSVGPSIISVDFKGTNTRPVVTTSDKPVRIKEHPDHLNANFNEQVLQLTVDDATEYNGLFAKMSADPERGLEYFRLVDQGGEWKVRPHKRLDYEYELLRSVRLYFEVSDGFCEAEVFSVLVELKDVNEPPTINIDYVERTVYEGVIEVDPGWTARDPDIDDELRWSTVTDAGGSFTVNALNGFILSTEDFDVDPDSPQKSRTVQVQVSDNEGQTATASIKLTVLDKNDNPPVFTSRVYRLTASECTKVGALLGTVNARDDDSSFQGNNVLVYGGAGNNITVLATGDVTLTKQCTAGKAETITATVTDQGTYPGPLSGVPTTVTFSCNVCPDPTDSGGREDDTPGIEDYPNDADDSARFSFLGWLILAALLSLLLLAVLAYALWRWCRWCSWRRKQRTFRPLEKKGDVKQKQKPKRQEPEEDVIEVIQLTPPEPPPPEREPFLFGFWTETYVDRNQRHQPERDIVPKSVAQDKEIEKMEMIEEEQEKEERRMERQKVEEDYRKEVEKYHQELRELQNPQPSKPPPEKKSDVCMIL